MASFYFAGEFTPEHFELRPVEKSDSGIVLLSWAPSSCDSMVGMGIKKRDTGRGRVIRAKRKAREYAMVVRALADTSHPVLAQIVPARFCNLSCGYCNEYDKVSEPVPLPEMYRRIDALGRLGTAMIGISGGEPLTHPQLDEIIVRMRGTGAIAGMITNGYLLNVERIERLNRAGLDHMQISIDNLVPDEVSKKSLKVLDKKLEMLAEHAEFHGGGRGLQGSERCAGDWEAGAGAGV
jgi:sulfatase maturation enzyme AslB (radical SAM superfamily)